MKILSFVGKNRMFRKWLKRGGPRNIISLAEFRVKKEAAEKTATKKIYNPIIA